MILDVDKAFKGFVAGVDVAAATDEPAAAVDVVEPVVAAGLVLVAVAVAEEDALSCCLALARAGLNGGISAI